MKPLSIQIVPAHPGFYTVIEFADTKEIEIEQPVIAWRIETYDTMDGTRVFSQCSPLTVDGEAVSNCIGIQNPDMTVTLFDAQTYKSLAGVIKFRQSK